MKSSTLPVDGHRHDITVMNNDIKSKKWWISVSLSFHLDQVQLTFQWVCKVIRAQQLTCHLCFQWQSSLINISQCFQVQPSSINMSRTFRRQSSSINMSPCFQMSNSLLKWPMKQFCRLVDTKMAPDSK